MKGFTLFETIIAIGLILVGLVAALTLVTTSLFYSSNIQNCLIAANLAAEGIEVIRNIRDNNWLQDIPWDSWLVDNGDYQVAYNSTTHLSAYYGQPILFDQATNLYSYDSGVATPFVRKISITNLSDNEIKITSTVTWRSRGISHESSAEDRLFNWK